MHRFAKTVALAALLAAAVAAPAAADLSDKLGSLTGDNAKGYLSPLPKAMSSTLNSGIFQTADVKKSGVHFTIGVHIMGVSFPDDQRTFTPTDAAAIGKVPTVVGDPNSVSVQRPDSTWANYPGGLDAKAFALAAPELTVGDVLGTRLMLRWFNADFGSSDYGKLDLFGIGGQHSISQYFPGMPVDLAVGAFYQTFKLGKGPLLDTKAFHVEVTGSKQLNLPGFIRVEPYAGLGYDTFSMDVSYTSTVTPGDEINISMDKQSNVHFDIGAQLTMALVKLHAEFVAAANPGAAIGLSFGR